MAPYEHLERLLVPLRRPDGEQPASGVGRVLLPVRAPPSTHARAPSSLHRIDSARGGFVTPRRFALLSTASTEEGRNESPHGGVKAVRSRKDRLENQFREQR
ncbi:hypothetical protein GCM10010363_39280 [Streptomyces omiyaensis]|nr:hypothetical protein GCM10010363_39280 [Streptomyces omiyaensis]